MPTDPDAAFHYAQTVHAAAYAAERRSEALSSAQLEVQRRQEEVDTRIAEIAALPDGTDELWRSRLGTASVIAAERLSWAQGHLDRIEKEYPE